jgi:hypothetical protein
MNPQNNIQLSIDNNHTKILPRTKSKNYQINELSSEDNQKAKTEASQPTDHGETVHTTSHPKISDEESRTTSVKLREDSIFLEARDNMDFILFNEPEIHKYLYYNYHSQNLSSETTTSENLNVKDFLGKIGRTAIQHKLKANNLFKKAKYRDAIEEYRKV